MKKNLFAKIALVPVIFIFGCSGANKNVNADSVSKVAAVDALAGVPYAGYVSLAATAVDILSRTGKPSPKKISPKLLEILKHTACPVVDKTCTKVVKWHVGLYKENGKVVRVPLEKSPQMNLDYAITHQIATCRYRAGDFGDGGPEVSKRNLEAWRDGKLLVAEYNGPNGVKLIAVSNHNEDGEMMLPEEWEERKPKPDPAPANPISSNEQQKKETP